MSSTYVTGYVDFLEINSEADGENKTLPARREAQGRG